jgi:hypothetical protein
MTSTTHLGITLVEQSQSQKEVTVNTAFTRIDALLNTGAKSRTTNTPPASPASGDLYIVGGTPTGAWSGQAGMLAYFDQLWKFIAPNPGVTLWVNDTGGLYAYNGSAWAGVTSPAAGSGGQLQYNNAGALTGVANSAVDSNGYIFPQTLLFALSGTRSTGTDLNGWVIAPCAGKFVKAAIIAKTAPTGAALICDILKSSNNGASWASLWAATPANRVQLAAGSRNGNQTAFDTSTFAAGDLLRIDIAQVGSTVAGADLTVSLLTLTQNT